MALFNKDRKRSKPPATDGAKSADGGVNGDAPLTHRVTKDLDRAETLATMLAHSRASRTVEVAEYVRGNAPSSVSLFKFFEIPTVKMPAVAKLALNLLTLIFRDNSLSLYNLGNNLR